MGFPRLVRGHHYIDVDADPQTLTTHVDIPVDPGVADVIKHLDIRTNIWVNEDLFKIRVTLQWHSWWKTMDMILIARLLMLSQNQIQQNPYIFRSRIFEQYRQTSYIGCTWVGNKIVEHWDVVETSLLICCTSKSMIKHYCICRTDDKPLSEPMME